MFGDFLTLVMDQLVNQAAKMPFMTGGAAQMALTVRTQFESDISRYRELTSRGMAHEQAASKVLFEHFAGR